MFLSIILTLIIAGVIYWGVQKVLFPYIAAPFAAAIQVFVIIALVLYLVAALTGRAPVLL